MKRKPLPNRTKQEATVASNESEFEQELKGVSEDSSVQRAVKEQALKRLVTLREIKRQYDWRRNARPSQWPPDWAWTIWLFKGGRGCLHPNTPIYDPIDGTSTSVVERARVGKVFHVLARAGDGSTVTTMALPPFVKGRERFLRVTLATGRSVTVTPQHRFLSASGAWVKAGELAVGDVLAFYDGDVCSPCPSDDVRGSCGQSVPGSLGDWEPCETSVEQPDAVTIASITSDGQGEFYDLHVPVYNNYWTEGVFHHNSGKTRAGAEWCRRKIVDEGCKRGGIIAPTASDARDVCIEGPSGLLSVFPPEDRPEYQPSRRQVIFRKYGAKIHVYSADDPTRFRGPQHEFMWADEIAYYPDPSEVWDTMMLGLRLGQHPQVMATTTPLPIPLITDLIGREGKDVAVTTGTTYDNLDNLAPTFREQVLSLYEGTHMARQEIGGELMYEIEGALWTRDMFQYCRRDRVPELVRVGVAIDPSLTKNRRSDEAGIIVGGKTIDDYGYILKDLSRKATPEQWARTAIRAYHEYEADFIVAEKNQGGDMVKTTLHSVDNSVKVKLVSAYRGKMLRAEPISAKYEQGKVYHVPGVDQVEAEMMTFDGTGRSPNRLDALVYLLKELIAKRSGNFDWDIL